MVIDERYIDDKYIEQLKHYDTIIIFSRTKGKQLLLINY